MPPVKLRPGLFPRERREIVPRLLLAGLVALLFAGTMSPADEMKSTFLAGNSRIDVALENVPPQFAAQNFLEWVHWASDSVITYYGKFPVPHLSLRISLFDGKGVRNGKTFGGDEGGRIFIHAGRESTEHDLAADWMLTHEMIHLAFPSVADEHHWIEEGLATYVEPIARVRAGHLDVTRMWSDFARDLPQGLPEKGDRGLDRTHTWGRTYWGGALFCFLADIEIHRRTQNQKGLEDALRGILNAGGDIRDEWDLVKTLKIGDDATGVAVLVPLYNQMKDQPYDPDLTALWKDLGIERAGDTVRFIDTAPLAGTRKAITYGAQSAGNSQGMAAPNVSVFAGRTARNVP
jgi:hypothetical protein